MCREWSKAVSLLTDIAFLEDKVGIGLAFDLVVDFADARRLLPEDNPHRRVVALIEESLRRDIHFIVRHAHDQPQSLFQCLWNSCWWWDCTEASGISVRRILRPLNHTWVSRNLSNVGTP